MKIIRDNKVYVQNSDLTHLANALAYSGMSCPEGVLNQVYGDFFICTPDNQNEFKELEGKEIVEFFSKLDYIVDYDKVKDLSKEELNNLGVQLCDERNSLVRQYNNMAFSDMTDDKVQKLYCRIKLLDYKIKSLSDFFWYKEKKTKVKFPNGIESPEEPKRKNILSRIFKKK